MVIYFSSSCFAYTIEMYSCLGVIRDFKAVFAVCTQYPAEWWKCRRHSA